MAHWKEAAVTNIGVEMLNEWMAGRKITITSAYGGTGTVNPGVLTEQTGLVDMRQELHLLGEENGADGKTVQVQVQNTGVTMEYELNQVGVYAVLDADRDPDAEERLLFIMQDEKGVAIPAAMDASFLLELYCMIGITNNGRFEVNVSAAGIVTIAYMQEKLEQIMAEHNADKGAHSSLAARMGMIETELNGSITIIQEADPSTETEGVKGQHYINAAAGTEFVCTGVTEAGYVWEPQEAGAAMTKNLLARIRGMELALNGSETISGESVPTVETKGVIGQHYINSMTGEEFVCTGVTEEGCIWEPLEAVKVVAQGLPLKAVTEEEYNALSEAEKAADVAYLVTDDASDGLEEHWSHRNMLDNWYLTDPVNQLGQEKYEGLGYTIDRWRIDVPEGIVSVIDGGIRIESNFLSGGRILFRQLFENIPAGVYTASVLVTGISGGWAFGCLPLPNSKVFSIGLNTYTHTRVDSTNKELYIWKYSGNADDYIEISAIKLEKGPVQTLAHQDGEGNWVLNDPPPDKALELTKCQRYCQVVPGEPAGYTMIGHGKATGSSQLDLQIPLPTSMRVKPSVRMTGNWIAVGGGKNITFTAEGREVIANSVGASEVGIVVSGLTGLASNYAYTIQRNNDAEAQIILDANL